MALPIIDGDVSQRPTGDKSSYFLPFALVCSLFFLWGLANSLNGTLVKQFQTALDLSRGQAGIVDSAFYLGYFVFAIPAGLIMQRWGYKRGILAGLLLYALGALLFYPAAGLREYGFFLFALFTIASGLAFLETAANLYVTVLGDSKGAEWRINFAQTFNGLSVILGPIIGGLLVFSKNDYTRDQLTSMPIEQSEAIRAAEALATRTPYMMIAGVVLFIALLFWLTRMPEVGSEEPRKPSTSSFGALLRHRHLVLGILAQLANVGAQVTLWSYFVDLKLGFSADQHLDFLSWFYPFADKTPKQLASFHASFALVLFLVGRFVGTILMSYAEARKVLLAFSILAVVCVALAFQGAGVTAVVCIMGTYFCQSIMFPTIFALATKGLAADERKMASSLVIMSIVGGAILPPIAGWLSHMQLSYMLIVPFVCFLFVAYYAASGYRQTAP